MRLILWMLILGFTDQKSLLEIKFTCPHDTRFETGFGYGAVDLPSITEASDLIVPVETSCPFEFNLVRKQVTSVKMKWWERKSSVAAGTNADQNTYEEKEKDAGAIGICNIQHNDITSISQNRRGLMCLEYSCNLTHCMPALHVIIPHQICMNIRTCLLTWKSTKIDLIFERIFCPHGILVAGNCFQPYYGVTSPPPESERAELSTTCFLITTKQSKAEKNLPQLVTAFQSEITGNTCSPVNMAGYYSCFIKGYSQMINVPGHKDAITGEIMSKIIKFSHGEDHDRYTDGHGILNVAGPLNFSLKSTDKFSGVCYSGDILYTSLYMNTKKSGDDFTVVLAKGIIPNTDHSSCDMKLLPLVWQGMINIPGYIEKMEPCKVFCTLSGPGASCEAFSSTGIFNISSDTCLIGKLHRYKHLEDQISFICQRVDQDLVIYCNGQKKVIKTNTLVIGQCIYTITSALSLLPTIAHPLAVELCVTGFHGWATLLLLITFCFGWLLIPLVSYLVIQVLRLILILMNKHTGQSRFENILKKLKDEFQHTIGSTTCSYCKTDCCSKEELTSHEENCSKGKCPYCLKEIGSSSIIATEHFKICPLIDRFITKIRQNVASTPTHGTLLYRKLGTFRYKNRCFIFTIWTVLIIIESLVWAVSAQKMTVDPGWSDTAHGVGSVPMELDYELDFALVSGSTFIHKRLLQSPQAKEHTIPFTVTIDTQKITAVVQTLGHWMDAEVNLKSVFHCYGACKAYKYPWQEAYCSHEVDYEYQSSWSCNPPTCPGISTGCTACGMYLDKLTPKASVYKIINIKYSRYICYQLGTEKQCKEVEGNDCVTGKHFKACLVGTVSNIVASDTLVFLGPLDAGALIMKQWCVSNCKLGDPGDIMSVQDKINCPSYEGTINRVCRFATMPVCSYQGNQVPGFKKMMATKDSFLSVNMSNVKLSLSTMSWEDPDSIYKDHINIVVTKDLDFEELSENPCSVESVISSIEGSWGSGVGFTITCSISLTECSDFLTTIKACDDAICYGGKAVRLLRGQNTVKVQGRGGHSGSKFRCCHENHCSTKGLRASSPHLERIGDERALESQVFSDGAPECGISCQFKKVWEWLTGIFSGNWFILIVLVIVMIISIIILSFFCPAKRKTS
ncbi:glycoprotein [Quezon virus]|uniref:Envelopment polyprotein n=1 Tax=Quezon virus TaxID=1841195 RepID=A0A1B0WVN1_9VIRU|nr:glycoprotein [Quezon virus]AND78464.1 glycoprotein [Quezon virus]